MRRAGSDGARTEAAILAAATELIAERGFAAVTLRGLARRVGLQPGSLYRYFPGKGDLLMAIVRRHMEELFAGWAGAEPAGAPPRERLGAFIAFHVRHHAARPREVLIANMELRSLAPADRRAAVAMRRRYEGILQGILEDGMAAGEFRVPDPRVATFAILAMLTGLTAWYQEGGRLSKEELVACYLKLVETGVS